MNSQELHATQYSNSYGLQTRYNFMPAFGSTNSNHSIRLFYLANHQNHVFRFPFVEVGLSFEYIISAFKKETNYVDYEQHQLIIRSTLSNKVIDPAQRLQAYKEEIEDTSRPYFTIYQQIITHNSEFIKRENKIKVEKVLEQKENRLERHWEEHELYSIIIASNFQNIQIKVGPEETIEEVKCEISKLLDVDLNSFILFFNGKKLQNIEATLQSYSVKKNDKLFKIDVMKSGCFSATSQIQISPTEHKNVKQLKVNDPVWSYNQSRDIFEQDFIESIHKTSLDYYLKVHLEYQTIVQCSPTHKFLTDTRQWKNFSSSEDPNKHHRLIKGDKIINAERIPLAILQIESVNLKKAETFYHISIKNNHTFIVNGLVSHNVQMRIVNNKDGVQFLIDTSEKDTIGDIKKKIFQYSNKYTVNDQILFLYSKPLKDKESLTDYQLDYKNTTLRLLMQSKQKVILHFIKEKKEYEFDIIKKQTVKELKQRILAKLGISITHQILFISNIELQNSKPLQYYQLQQNYNRITLIEVQNDQITQTNAPRFQDNTEMLIRIKENYSIKVKYITFKEMKVKEFIYCMVEGSNISYSLMFGEHVLNPNDRLYSIEKLPFYNQEKIQGQLIKNYDRLTFYDIFVVNVPFDTSKMAKIKANEEEKILEKQALIENEYREKTAVTNLLGLYHLTFQTFCKSIMYFTSETIFSGLSDFLLKMKSLPKEQVHQHKEFNFCSVVTRSLLCLPRFIGQTHKLISNLSFSSCHNSSELFYWDEFVPTFPNEGYASSLMTKKCTLFHIESLTGRQIGIMTAKGQKQVVFLPYTCFFIQMIRENQNYDEVWLIELPTPLTFLKPIILTVDDIPKDNLKLMRILQSKNFQVIPLISTLVAEVWMKQFGWFLKRKNIECKIVSDMVRYQKDKGSQVYQAGIDLVQCLYNTHGFTIPIVIYCKDVQLAHQNIIRRNINPNRIALVTRKLKEVQEFCTKN